MPEDERGTYAGLSSEAALRYLRDLGVTAVELLPVHVHSDDSFLVDRGLVNYWGYNTMNFFAPDPRYALADDPQEVVREFKTMVRNLHDSKIEVILDVVYNHTAEGNHLGPTFSFRGIDNASYYRLVDKDPRYYMDYTGCGNTLNMQNPRVLQIIMDSLRYWVIHMHVDGFRFDLASTLARELHEVDKLARSSISSIKIPCSRRSSSSPSRGTWAKAVTRWGTSRCCGRSGMASTATVCGDSGRATAVSRPNSPLASAARATCTNGAVAGLMPVSTSLRVTMVSPCATSFPTTTSTTRLTAKRTAMALMTTIVGIAAPKAPPTILRSTQLRAKKQRAFLATLMLSEGVPMLLAGDEIGHTQKGSNNAYCQDNEITWLNWELNEEQVELLEFTRKVISFVHEQPVFQRRRFFHEKPLEEGAAPEIEWLSPDGDQMSGQDWSTHHVRCLGVHLRGGRIDVNEYGEPIIGDHILVLYNADHTLNIPFNLPPIETGEPWQRLFDTAIDEPDGEPIKASTYDLQPVSVAVFRSPVKADVEQAFPVEESVATSRTF